jgi:hypothetical protein
MMDKLEAALDDVAQAAAEVAQSANHVSEGIRFRLPSRGDSEAGGEQRDLVGELADALAETAAELHLRAVRLSRARRDEALPPLDLPAGQRPAVRRLPRVPEAGPAPAELGFTAVSDGLRVIVTKMLSDGWSHAEAAYYLWAGLGIRDSHAVVARVADRASALADGRRPVQAAR